MKRFSLVIGLIVLLVAANAFAISATRSGNVIEISTLDADWAWTDTFTSGYPYANGIRAQYIIFYPSAANDILVLEEGSDSGPEIFPVKCNDTYDQRIVYPGATRIKPVFDYTDSTITTPADAKIIILLQDN